MARKKKEVISDAPIEEAEEPKEEKEEKSSVTVTWRGQSRVYSREVHGADFKKLAKEFAEKKGGELN